MAALVSVTGLLYLMQAMLDYRNVGVGDYKEVTREQGAIRVDDNFYRLCQIVQIIPEQYPYLYHKYILYVLVRPVPRIFWPGKPVDGGFDLPEATGVKGASLS